MADDTGSTDAPIEPLGPLEGGPLTSTTDPPSATQQWSKWNKPITDPGINVGPNTPPPADQSTPPSDEAAQDKAAVDSAQARLDAARAARIHAEQQAQEAHENFQKSRESMNASLQKTQSDVAALTEQIKNPPSLDPKNPQDHKDINNLAWVFPTVIALGALIAGARGKGSGAGARFFMAGLLSGYADGQKEFQKEMREGLQEQIKFQHEQNQERIENMAKVISAEHLDLDAKIAIGKNLADEYGWKGMSDAAVKQAQGDEKAMATELENAKKAEAKYLSDQRHIAKSADRTTKSKDLTEYYNYIDQEWTKAHPERHGAPPQTKEELAEAYDQAQKNGLTYAYWFAQIHKVGEADPRTGVHKPIEGKPDKSDSDKRMEDWIKKHYPAEEKPTPIPSSSQSGNLFGGTGMT